MAIDKGKQFEYAIMIAAYSRVLDPPSNIRNELGKLLKQPVGNDVQQAANNMMDIIQPKSFSNSFYTSFKQLGGSNPEPKTDVLFVKNGKKYKCSMKWGDAYQLSSSGIQGTVRVLNNVLFKVAMKGNMGGAQVKEVAMVLDELSETLG